MPRPDPGLLDLTRYPLVQQISTRYSDIDVNRHINNVAIAAMLEENRAQLVYLARQPATMIVHVSIDYLAQAFYPGPPMTAGLAVESLGRTTWHVAQILLQEETVVAFSRSVAVNTADGRPEPLDPEQRAILLEYGLRDG